MKKIITFIVFLFCTCSLFSQAVRMFSGYERMTVCSNEKNFIFKCEVRNISGPLICSLSDDNDNIDERVHFFDATIVLEPDNNSVGEGGNIVYIGNVLLGNISLGAYDAKLTITYSKNETAKIFFKITFLEPVTTGSISSTGQLLCENNIGNASSIPVLSSPTKGGGSYSYQWERTGSSGNTSIVSNSLNFKPSQTGIYKLLVTDTYCEQHANVAGRYTANATGIWEVKTQPAPAQPPVPSGSNGVCQGSTQTYRIDPINNANNYAWSLNNSNAGQITNNGKNEISVKWNEKFSGNVQLSVKAENVGTLTCQSPVSNPLAVTVYEIPKVPDMPSGPVALYQGSSGTYRLSNASSNIEYIWKLDNPDAGEIHNNGESEVIVDWNRSFSGMATLSVAARRNGCQSDYTQALSVDISRPQTPSRPIGETFVCQGKVSYYEINSDDISVEYIWKLSNENAGIISGNSTKIMIQWNPDFMGKVGLSVAASSKEQTVTSDYSKPLIINVDPVPMANFIDYKTEICSEGTIYPQATYSVEGLSACMAYFWEVTDGEIVSGQETDKIEVEWKPENNKSGEVILTSSLSSGCSARQVLDVNFCSSETSVTEAKSNTRMSIYPNPNKGDFMVTFSGLLNEIKSEARLQISASNGQLLQERVISGFKDVSFNEDLPSGYYLISLIVDGKIVATEHFIVNK